MQKTGSLYIANQNIKWYSYSEKQFDTSLKNKTEQKQTTPIHLLSCTPGHSSQRNKNLCSHSYL